MSPTQSTSLESSINKQNSGKEQEIKRLDGTEVAELQKILKIAQDRQSGINYFVKTLHERDIVIHREALADGSEYRILPSNLTGRLGDDLSGQQEAVAKSLNDALKTLYAVSPGAKPEVKTEWRKSINDMFVIAFMNALRQGAAAKPATVAQFKERHRGRQSANDFLSNLKDIPNQTGATSKLIDNIVRADIDKKALLKEKELTPKEQAQMKAFRELAAVFESSIDTQQNTRTAVSDLSDTVQREMPISGVGGSVGEKLSELGEGSPELRSGMDKINDMFTSGLDISKVGGFMKILGGVFLVGAGLKWGLGKNKNIVQRLLGAFGAFTGSKLLMNDDLKSWIGGMRSDVQAGKKILGEKQYNDLMKGLAESDIDVPAISVLSQKSLGSIKEIAQVDHQKRTVTFPNDWAGYQKFFTTEEMNVLEHRFGTDAKKLGALLGNVYYNIGAVHNPRVAAVHPELREGTPPSCAYLGYLYLEARYGDKGKGIAQSRLKLNSLTLGEVLVKDVFAKRTPDSEVHKVDMQLGMIYKEEPKKAKQTQTVEQPVSRPASNADLHKVAGAPTPEQNRAPDMIPATPVVPAATNETVMPQTTPSTAETPESVPTVTAAPAPVEIMKLPEPYQGEEKEVLLDRIQKVAGGVNVKQLLETSVNELAGYLRENNIPKAKEMLDGYGPLLGQASAVNIKIDLGRFKSTIVEELKKFRDTIPEFEQKVNYMLSK